MFSYIVPNVTLSLHAVGAAYQVQCERCCGCNGQKPPVVTELVTHHDNHVLAWYRWKKEQKWENSKRLRELQKQDDLDAAAFRKVTQEKERMEVIARRAERRRQTTLKTEWRELETLKQLLQDVLEGPVHDALLNMWSNASMLWNDGGEATLKHYGKILLTLEWNRLQHALNGNIKDELTR